MWLFWSSFGNFDIILFVLTALSYMLQKLSLVLNSMRMFNMKNLMAGNILSFSYIFKKCDEYLSQEYKPRITLTVNFSYSELLKCYVFETKLFAANKIVNNDWRIKHKWGSHCRCNTSYMKHFSRYVTSINLNLRCEVKCLFPL